MLNTPNKEYEEDEKKIMEKLLVCIDQTQSVVFNAGAGSGKTYALIECLKHLCRDKEVSLKQCNQKAICITYTNVAANEIKKRLGNTEVVLVSTIHEWLWEFIKEYQEALLLIHCEYLEKQIDELQQEIETNVVYSGLTKDSRDKLTTSLVEKQKEYYDLPKPAKEFKEQFPKLFPFFTEEISNAEQFRKTCFKIIKVHKYRHCIDEINNGTKEYTEVKYDARSNKDILQHMKISHDTLLIYAEKIISQYDELKRFIADKYPYFFVDEYQDTNELVVKILSEVEEYSLKIKHPVFVGYFGDSVQNIYDKGIGAGLEVYCGGYVHINKGYNRRSCSEIIELANKIRNDDIEQKSIYEDSSGGSVQAFYGTEENIDDFIRKESDELKKEALDEQVHCFLLKNEIVAKYSGLIELYDWFNSTPFYKRNYDLLSTELLSNDVNKLGEIQRYLYNLTEFYLALQVDDTPLLDIVNKELFMSLNIMGVEKIVKLLKKLKAVTLKDMLFELQSLQVNIKKELIGNKDGRLVDSTIDAIMGIENYSYDGFVTLIKRRLFGDVEDIEGIDEKVNTFLELDMSIMSQWCYYIDRECQKDIMYHTFHGTKGLEYENVIMIFGDDFGSKKKNFFNNYFSGYNREIVGDEAEKYKRARNLLYVAVTRARKNIRILYTGDYEGKKDIFDSIFGNVKKW